MIGFLVPGCGWLDRAAGNPKQEAYFMSGQNYRQTGQFPAARDAFQKAIEVNPANYFAHQELGDLYHLYLNDPGVALYHYRRYLEIGQRIVGRSFSDPAAETGIQGCELKLAEHTVGQFARQRTTVEVDQLKRENSSLRQQLAEAERQLQLRAQEARLNPAGPMVNPPSTPTPIPAPTSPVVVSTNPVPAPRIVSRQAIQSRPSPGNPPPSPQVSAARTYVIRSGDTPATIARSQGVRLPALLAANPGLDPRRLKVGQTIQLPAK